MNKKIIWGIGAIVVLIAVFWLGMSYSSSRNTSSRQFGSATGTGQSRFSGMNNRGGRNGAVFMAGEIIGIEGQNLTIKLRDGGSRNILFSTSTEIMKTASGSISDLITGGQITAIGKTNADGSLTASSIQIRPKNSLNRLP